MPLDTSRDEAVIRSDAPYPGGIFSTMAVLLRRWRTVVGTTALTIVLALPYAFLRPSQYVARTVLVPAQDKSVASRTELVGGQLGGDIGRLLSSGGPSSTQRLIGTILRSRTVQDSVVKRYERTAGSSNVSQVRKAVSKNTNVDQNLDGSVVLTVIDREPRRAAWIANEMPELLNSISVNIGTETALRRQSLLAQQVESARMALTASEQRLAAFQRSRNLPEPQEQARRTIEAAATLQRTIGEQQLTVSRLRRSMTSSNPQLRVEVDKLNDLRAELGRLSTVQPGAGQVLVPIGQSPTLRVEATRLEREYRTNEQIYIALTAGFAQAQLDVTNDMPIVSTLDPAKVPLAPYRPWKPLLAIALMFGALAGIALAFIRETLDRARKDAAYQPFFSAWRGFKGDFARLLPGVKP